MVVGFVEGFGAHVYDVKCGGYTSNKDEEWLSESRHCNIAKCIKYPADPRGRTLEAQRHLSYRHHRHSLFFLSFPLPPVALRGRLRRATRFAQNRVRPSFRDTFAR